MKLPIVYYGNPILRKKCAHVEGITNELRQLANAMVETMMDVDGLGLAAPQVNRAIALFVVHVAKEYDPSNETSGETLIFINPKILEYSPEEWWRGEGCLSLPEVYGPVSRPVRIKIEATDINGNRFTREFSQLEARAIMHENDHINGVLFIDRIQGKARQEIEADLRALKKKHPPPQGKRS
ncbi:MAG: peptide deformylase [Parachlamydiaceae bacterium]